MGLRTKPKLKRGRETSTIFDRPITNDHLVAGDLVTVDFGVPQGLESGFIRLAVVVSAAGYLRANSKRFSSCLARLVVEAHLPTSN